MEVAGCGVVELHATTVDDNNVMQMRPAGSEELTVAAGATLEMRPGGLHVMCIEAAEPFVEGDTVAAVVRMAEAGSITAEIVIEAR